MLPFLVFMGLAQLLIMASIVACVIYLPIDYKLLAAVITAFEAFVIFPWWFAVIHLYAVFDSKRFQVIESVYH